MDHVQVVAVEGRNALQELDRLRSQYPSSGLYPVLLGDKEDHSRILDGSGEEFNPAETIVLSKTIEPAAWFLSKKSDEPELYQEAEGDWPESMPDQMGIITHQDILSGKPKDQVLIALLKVAEPWEVFAHLNWGAWNDCPSPEEHCALHRYWGSQYGAEVVSVTGDIVQCVVSRPPKDRPGSLKLAHEQYVYCYDIVEQGVGSIAALGASLLGSQSWYFWWD